MWKVLLFLTGSTVVYVEAGSPEWLLDKLVRSGILLAGIRMLDDISMELRIPTRQTERLRQLIQEAGGTCTVRKEQGVFYLLRGLKARPWLWGTLLLWAVLVMVIPRFVFFYEVEGNETVPDEQILRTLEQLGVGFGTYGPSIHPQELKNEMLWRIPKLRWLTVQQNGMCARVVVREREEEERIYDKKTPTNVVASRSGLITSVDCFAGNCLCQPGQAVAQGQLLVSAYTDFGYKTQVTAAMAEIYADTVRRFEAVMPKLRQVRQQLKKTYRQIRFCMGKQAWSLGKRTEPEFGAKQSVTYRNLRLPGGFSFPLGIEIITVCEYDIEQELYAFPQSRQIIQHCARQFVTQDMIAGTIESQQLRVEQTQNGYTATCVFRCREMIARMVAASIKEETE